MDDRLDSAATTLTMDEIPTDRVEEADAAYLTGATPALSTVIEVVGAAVSLGARASTNATVATDSGAELKAHDNDRGILVVRAGEPGQVVHANVSGDAEANAESDDRVVVRKDDGTSGTFIVVGEGNVTVDERGNATVNVAEVYV